MPGQNLHRDGLGNHQCVAGFRQIPINIVRMGSQDDGRISGSLITQARNQVQSVEAGHMVIGNQQINRVRMFLKVVQALLGTLEHGQVVPHQSDHPGMDPQHGRIVIDNDDIALCKRLIISTELHATCLRGSSAA